MKKAQFLCFVIGLLLAINPAKAKESTQKTDNNGHKPNLIFYLADDQDKPDYGCYGNTKVHTPGVDRLASEGVLFQNAFTGQAICAPSRSQLYTGKYPIKNGCSLNHIESKPGQKSIAQYLQSLGYEVILAGKSHVAPASVYSWSREWSPVKVNGAPRPFLPLDSIQHYFKTANKPFCMFITSEYPHGPYVKGKTPSDDEVEFYPYEVGKRRGRSRNAKAKGGYYRSISNDNDQLEEILSWVDKYLDDNTLFIYSADHGMTGKWTLYDAGLNIPFVVRWPAVIKPHSQSDVMIHYTDVLPTFIEAAGGKSPKDIDGTSFLPVLKGSDKEIHKYVYGVQADQNVQRTAVFPSRMIRSKNYKYIRNFNSMEVVDKNMGDNKYVNAFIRMGAEKYKDVPFEELYDMVNDPNELHNLAKDPKYAGVKEKLVTEMYKWMKEQGDFLGKVGYMPLLKPTLHPLDKTTKYKTVPPELENTLKDSDYLQLHY